MQVVNKTESVIPLLYLLRRNILRKCAGGFSSPARMYAHKKIPAVSATGTLKYNVLNDFLIGLLFHHYLSIRQSLPTKI